MLVLSRKPEEVIVISDPENGRIIARVVVNSVRGEQVKIGVDAPSNVMVDRYEIYQRKVSDAKQTAV